MEQTINQNSEISQPPVTNQSPTPKNNLTLLLVIFFILLAVFGGIVIGKYLSTPKKETPPIPLPTTTQPKPTTVSDQTADWKTYRNEIYGYEFKYPNNWFLEEMPKNVTGAVDMLSSYKLPELQVKDPDFWKGKLKIDIGRMIQTKKPEQSLNDWLIEYEKESLAQMTTKISQEKTTLDGKQTIKITNEFKDNKNETSLFYIIEKNNYIYFINGGNDFSGDLKKTFDLFLSTFKFLP